MFSMQSKTKKHMKNAEKFITIRYRTGFLKVEYPYGSAILIWGSYKIPKMAANVECST